MKWMKQFGIILLVSFVGEVLEKWIPLPIPASIYGIILLFLCLKLRIIPHESVHETGKFLIEIMPLMFIPAAVGLLAMVPPVARSNIFFICVFTFRAASQQRDFFASLLVTKKEEPYSRMLLYTVVTAWG